MINIRLLSAYIEWHFTVAVREVFDLWKNLVWFGYHFFSIPLLMKTLFRPIFRVHESAPPGTGINIELFFENLTINLIARIVGFFLRVVLIFCGAFYQLIMLLLAPVLFFAWLAMPFLPFIFIIAGIRMIAS